MWGLAEFLDLAVSLLPHISALWIGIDRIEFASNHVERPIQEIIRSLTLPFLEELEIDVEQYPGLVPPWPQEEFLALSAQLLRCLGTLPAIEALGISDHQLVADGGVHQVTPHSSCLVPRLTYFACQSLLEFHKTVYLNFVLSRSQDGPAVTEGDTYPFQAALWWLPGRYRELDTTVAGRLDELCLQKKLVFSFEEAES
ncbi:hypothetical protein DFH07DRAFT_784850 [Mycena maculata]|uniref:Uncharacterized protein n=1 Tax=Mycena maculata TaxID=230809 RepID=A0AAD7HE92_9AGAR|nr:hypothetical protein DFH07DRAFT_784850 [Mycena maculata]